MKQGSQHEESGQEPWGYLGEKQPKQREQPEQRPKIKSGLGMSSWSSREAGVTGGQSGQKMTGEVKGR